MPQTTETLTRYIAKWYVPQLGMWIDIGVYQDEEQARKAELWFRERITQNWHGEIKTAVIRISETAL